MAMLPSIDFVFGADAPASDKAVASHSQTSGSAAADLSCIGEIFAGAKRLDALDAQFLFELDPGNQKYRGMRKPRLDVVAFMADIEESPLFLRRAG